MAVLGTKFGRRGPGTYTLSAEDQPEKLTAAIEEFLTTTVG
ncbi:hypothetical protein [Rhodococcus pyridinivorans]